MTTFQTKTFNLLSLVQTRAANYLDAFTNSGDCAGAAAAAQALIIKLSGASPGRSVSLWNKLLKLSCRCGLNSYAHKLFDKIPHRDFISYNTIFSASAHGLIDATDALRLYSRMLSEVAVKPDRITFAELLAVSPDQTEQIHCHAVKFGVSSDAFVGGALVNGYERCRGLDEAVRAFEDIGVLDSVSWNIMIDACARRGCKKHAVEIFSRMQKQCGGKFDAFTVTSVLKTCKESEDVGLGRQLHGCSMKARLIDETSVGNAIATMYLKCGGRTKEALEVFRQISDPNIISWTAIITGLAQDGLAEETVQFYKGMLSFGVIENEFCFASVLPAFGLLASISYGRMVHCRIIKLEFCFDVTVGSALIDMYFKCGSINDAQIAFEAMKDHDAVSWTVMILGLGQQGRGRQALEFFREMERSGTSPDGVTFLAGLSACCYCGMVEEGIRIFRSMVNEYGITPTKRHCACLIDLLGCVGRLGEAEKLICDLGIKIDPQSLETLFGACRVHGAFELAERSAQEPYEIRTK